MNSNDPLPSTASRMGWFCFWLPLLVLLACSNLLCSNVWSDSPRYQDIDLNNCPALTVANVATFAAKQNTPANSLTCPGPGAAAGGCDVAAVNNPTSEVTWAFDNDAPDGGCEGASQSPFTCAGINVTVPTGTVPGTTKVQLTNTSPLNTLRTSYFFLTATASGGAPQCKRWYRFSVTADGGGWGDPHITTVDGIHYDFQSAGEFIALRGSGLEIQTRQTPVATTGIPGANPYTGLATCVAIYTAVAARAGTHRVTYEPNVSGVPDPTGLQLRVDGVLTALGPAGIDLAPGGPINQSQTRGAIVEPPLSARIVKSPVGDGIEIHYSNGAMLVVTPAWWPDQQKWYLNVNVYGTMATEGIFGKLAKDSWLPALPDGTSLGPKPGSLHERYVDLYEKFAGAWRVTDQTSLFDYAPGTSTATFTLGEWPRESPRSCTLEGQPAASPVDAGVAEKQCSKITDANMKADCVFDVSVTGHTGFAQTYLLTQQLQPDATETTIKADKDPSKEGESVAFTATVAQKVSRGGAAPTGTVQFVLDGSQAGNPITLDPNGRALWSTSSLQVGQHQIVAEYIPAAWGGLFTASTSPAVSHTVSPEKNLYLWLVILLLLVVILIAFIIWRYLRTA